MNKIYNCNNNIVNKHMDKDGMLVSEPLKNFYAALIDHFKRLFGVHSIAYNEEVGANGEGTTYKVMGFLYAAGLAVPVMLTYGNNGHVVFVRAFDIDDKQLADLAQVLADDITFHYKGMGVEINNQHQWLEMRFFHINDADDNGFEYNGLHFTPTDRTLCDNLREITRHLQSTRDSRLRRYDGGTYDYDAFYTQARKAGCGQADTFNCLELDAEFCPGNNELFMYIDEL